MCPAGKGGIMVNMELNELRKIICLRKSKVNVYKKVSDVIEKLVEHGIHFCHAPIQMTS